MRILSLLTILSIGSAFASTNQTKMYASLYANELLREFDAKLDLKLALNDTDPMYLEDEYQKLLAARILIEQGEDHSHGRSHLIKYPSFNSKDYATVRKSIIAKSKSIKANNYKRSEAQSNLVIYPSVSSDGNLTGNTYPKNVWSLTFDDGPHKTRTNRVLDNLNTAGQKATFFVLTKKAKIYKSITNSLINDGMELALHSYSHPNLSKSTSDLDFEIGQAKKDLEKQTNVDLKVFRLPYGAGMRSSRVRKSIAQNNMVHIFWNIDTLDWQDKDPESIFKRTVKMMKLAPNNSGIILFHDIHNQSVIASKMVMEYLNNNNKTVCTVSEVINFMNHRDQDCI